MPLFGKRSKFSQVFGDTDSLCRPAAEAPAIVPKLVDSFKFADGSPADVEVHWLYTGAGPDVLDRVHFGITLGAKVAVSTDVFDGFINVTGRTCAALAVHRRTRQVGLLVVVVENNEEPGFLSYPPGAFIADEGHLMRDRPLAAYLKPTYRRQLEQALGKPVDQASDRELESFVLNHPECMESPRMSGGLGTAELIVYLPDSMTVDIFATEGSYHPTRGFLEPIARDNKFEAGGLLADGHVHHALTEKRVAGQSWLQMLRDRYGAVGGAGSLSVYDVDMLMRIENVGKHLDVPSFQLAARELYVVDDERTVVGHSAINLVAIMADDSLFNRFMDVATRAIGSPGDPQLRLAFHDMMHDFTVDKPVTEPLLLKDYSV